MNTQHNSEEKSISTNDNTLTENEAKEKLILDFAFLKSEVELCFEEGNEKKTKPLIKQFLNFEKELEDILKIKISNKEKNIFLKLKKENFDHSILKLSKYI